MCRVGGRYGVVVLLLQESTGMTTTTGVEGYRNRNTSTLSVMMQGIFSLAFCEIVEPRNVCVRIKIEEVICLIDCKRFHVA